MKQPTLQKALKKKRRHEEAQGVDIQGSEEETSPPCNLLVVLASLKALDAMLSVCSSRNWSLWRDDVDRLLVNMLLNFPEPTADLETHVAIKLQLYRCLFGSSQIPTTGQPASLPYTIRLLSSGKQDRSLEVKSIKICYVLKWEDSTTKTLSFIFLIQRFGRFASGPLLRAQRSFTQSFPPFRLALLGETWVGLKHWVEVD